MSQLQLRLAVPVRTLVLIGGGEFSFGETKEIDRYLLSRMPAGRRTVAFLPTASGSAEYASHFGKYLRELDPSVEVINVPIYRGRDSRRPKNLATLTGAGMIYVGGGVTNNLLDTMLESAADLAMRDAAASGAVIAAIGAAASCFGVFARDMRGASALPGMAWIEATAIETGFEPGNDTTLRRLMSVPNVDLGLGIPAKTAISIGHDGMTEILGDGQIAAFRKPAAG
ncbi:MAG TPA: Type 1 glutamine amidotransferase-like domain-containing protein [Thermoanaerobaculia bacterium]